MASTSRRKKIKMTAFPNHLKLFGQSIYDLHITVDEKQIYDVLLFSRIHKVNLAFPVGKNGPFCRQLMTSQHIEGTAETVFAESESMVKKLNNAGVTVLRVKIEAMANPPTMRRAMKEFMQTEEFLKNLKYSFEFHYKVVIDDEEQQKTLESLCNKYCVSFASNLLSKKQDKYPLISQRVRGNYEHALDQRETFQKMLVQNGITLLLDGTHFEAIIYDSNYSLDTGFVPDPIQL